MAGKVQLIAEEFLRDSSSCAMLVQVCRTCNTRASVVKPGGGFGGDVVLSKEDSPTALACSRALVAPVAWLLGRLEQHEESVVSQ